MPTYTYECKKCGHEMDLFHAISAKPRVKCDECGGACRRLLGAGAGIIFKGSGFYETDYKTKSGKPPETSEKDKSSKDGGADKKSSAKKDGQTADSGSKAASKD